MGRRVLAILGEIEAVERVIVVGVVVVIVIAVAMVAGAVLKHGILPVPCWVHDRLQVALCDQHAARHLRRGRVGRVREWCGAVMERMVGREVECSGESGQSAHRE